MGIIRVQLGYVQQRLGKEKEAQIIYNSVLKTKPDDIGLIAVASNNLLTINRYPPLLPFFALSLSLTILFVYVILS